MNKINIKIKTISSENNNYNIDINNVFLLI